MILHTFNKGLGAEQLMRRCSALVTSDDAILLIEDGVYWGTATLAPFPMQHPRVFALTADVAARGLATRIAQAITTVDHAGFVQLCVEHDTVKSWF
jgi:tRNA 2-thiouridine synthesizing protein B